MAKVLWWMLAGLMAITLAGVARADCCDEYETCQADAKCACEKDKGTCSCKTKPDEKCACEKEDGKCACKSKGKSVSKIRSCPCMPGVAWVVWKMLTGGDCCADGSCPCPFTASHNEGNATTSSGCAGGMCPMMKQTQPGCGFNPVMALPPPPLPGLPPMPGMPPIGPPFTPSLHMPQVAMPAMPMMPPMPPQFTAVAAPAAFSRGPVVRCVAVTAVKPAQHCVLKMKVEDGEIRMVVDQEGKACVTCSRMTLKLGDSHEVHVYVTDNKLMVEGEGIDASAEKLTWSKEEGLMLLEGKVEFRYVKEGKHVDAAAEKIVVGLRDERIEVDPK